MIIIRKPYSVEEFEEYYDLRYNILRKPWNQKKGSEKDNLEFYSFHYAAFYSENFKDKKIVGVIRGHIIEDEAQIRYTAVKEDFRNKKIGFLLLKTIENNLFNKVNKIFLNSRINAVKFYEKYGYRIIKEIKPLFGIRHFRMEKIKK